MKTETEKNSLFHVRKVQSQFKELVSHLRSDIKLVDDPQCKALFETSAEVLNGLIKAFEDYKNKSEPAWKK